MDDPVTSWFAWLNFFALVAVGVYLVRNYVLPLLRAQRDEQARERLRDEKMLHHLALQAQEVRAAHEVTVRECAGLEEKIAAWREVFTTQQAQMREQHARAVERLDEMARQQVRQRAVEHERQRLVPAAFAAAREELVANYASEALQQKFLNTLVQSCERRIS